MRKASSFLGNSTTARDFKSIRLPIKTIGVKIFSNLHNIHNKILKVISIYNYRNWKFQKKSKPNSLLTKYADNRLIVFSLFL